MEIRFGRFCIREFEKSDVEALVRYGNNPRVSAELRDSFPFPYRRADALSWLKFTAVQDPPSNFAIASQEELIGGIGLRFFSDVDRLSAELGYWLGEPYWGQGIGTAAVRHFTLYAFRTYEIGRIFAEVFSGNLASIKLLEKCGFLPEGVLRRAVVKNGELKDKYIFGLLKEEADSRDF